MFRFASSPTEDINIENLRIALFNFICAKQQNDGFIARIEDIDKKRNIKEKDKDILEILDIFGITYDNLYYQSSNFKYHLQFASTLLDEKKAFMCFCSKEELEKKEKAAIKAKKKYKYDGTCENIGSEEILESRKPFVIRIKKPKKIENNEIDSFVIMRVDKYPTYDFACAIDDMLQGITHVICSEDYLLNAPKQEYIRKSLGYFEKISYIHLPKILNTTNSVKYLLNHGFLPEAIINYLVLLGNKTPKEIFTLDEALKWFDINLISKSPVRFDIDKLKLLNKEHIKLLSDEELAKRIGYSGIKQKIDAIFAKKIAPKDFTQNLEILKKIIKNAPYFDEFDEFKKYLTDKSKFEEKFLYKLLGILLTNDENGHEFIHLYPFIKNYLKEIAR